MKSYKELPRRRKFGNLTYMLSDKPYSSKAFAKRVGEAIGKHRVIPCKEGYVLYFRGAY